MTEDIEARPYRYYSAAQLDTLFVRLSNKLRFEGKVLDIPEVRTIEHKLTKIDEERDRR